MKGIRNAVITVPLVTSVAGAAPSIQQQDGILSFPLKATAALNISKRQIEAGIDDRLMGTLYTIDIAVGTPGQTVSLQVHTGVDELWFNPVCSKSFNPAECATIGRFTQSTTLVDLGVQGGQQTEEGSVEWEYVYDSVQVGSARIPSQIFGVAYNSEYFVAGVLGLAPSLAGWDSSYPYLLDSLQQQGFITSRAFSLDLRDIDSDDGTSRCSPH
jgi:hypothetical protein